MIKLNNLTLKKSINKAYLKVKPVREDFENFKDQLFKLLSIINEKESEEHNKNFVRDFLINTFYSDKYVNTSGKTDLAIHMGRTSKSFVGVIIETKRPSEKYDMISEVNLNCKAMHEVILYYLRERIENANDEIKNIIITNAYKWFIFKADQFEKHFYKSKLKNEYLKWRDDKKVSKLNEHFYNEIVKKYIDESDAEIEVVSFDLRDYEKYLNKKNEKRLIPLFKKFSPPELLKEPFANDSNNLNKQFYSELLHIIGLEEYKEGSKKKIGRKDEKNRDNGSLIENTIRMLKARDVVRNVDDIIAYGNVEEEQLYNIALELNIVWINRIMFLKLLEAQLVNYHSGDTNYKFLEPKIIRQYDDLFELFHEVLAVKDTERNPDLIDKFKNIPYLNSSLFELSDLEKKTINISELKDRFNLPFYKKTVFGNEIKSKSELPALDYLLLFLDAHDFASESGDEILEEHKTIINASVLGLIFEKINGYKEGSFYTPGFITMYMACETLRRAVVQKFNEVKGTKYKDYEELRKNINTSSSGREEANKIINDLKICDPAVGSGHFLVSCLNEIIAIKADLKVLNYRDGRQIQNYSFEIENDELVIINEETDELFNYHLNLSGKPITALQEMQEAIFHEKETIIENCLFGVDINPNSVNICRLRLWIELLKNSYYTKESNYTELETLPNIDINIKQGNSLVSRFDVRQDIFTPADRRILDVYKMNVTLYKNEQDRDKRRELKNSIDKTKERFRGIAVDPLKKEREQIDKLTEKLHKLNTGNLFDGNRNKEEQEKIEKKRSELVEKINKLTEQKSKKAEEYLKLYANAFEWRFEFPEVLDDEGNFAGFDVVIGNPPYIRQEQIKVFDVYLKLNYKSYSGKADIYVYFFEVGLRVAKISGFLTFITSSKYFEANYGKPLLDLLSIEMQILDLTDFKDLEVFEGVIAYPLIFKGKKQHQENYDIKYIEIDSLKDIETYLISETLPQITLSSKELINNNFKLIDPIIQELINKISLDSFSLEQFCGLPLVGVKTGYNNAFIVERFNSKYVKPYIFGQDIKKYKFIIPNKYIIFPYDENYKLIEIESEQEIKKILIKNKNRLSKRAIISDGLIKSNKFWYEYQQINKTIKFDTEYIVYPNVSLGNNFTIATNVVVDMTGFIIKSNDRFLLGILNSKLFEFLLKQWAIRRRGGYLEYKVQYLKKLPIKKPNKTIENSFKEIVVLILSTKKQNPNADTRQLESEIDQMVYKLYGLTEEEIKIVEGE